MQKVLHIILRPHLKSRCHGSFISILVALSVTTPQILTTPQNFNDDNSRKVVYSLPHLPAGHPTGLLAD